MKRLALAAALAAAFSAPVAADTMKFTGFQYANETSIAFNIKTASGTKASYAGGFVATQNGKTFLTYCVDLLQTFSWNTSYTDYTPVSVGDSRTPWFTAQKAYDLGRLFTADAAKVTDYITSAAMQLATWAIVNETGPSYSVLGNGLVATPYFSGTKTQENQAINLAETWLHSLPGYSAYSIRVDYSPRQQDVILASHVPEPASAALLLGSLGILTARRMSRKPGARLA